MYLFASIFGLWLQIPVSPYHVGPIQFHPFIVIEGSEDNALRNWEINSNPFSASEVYFVRPDPQTNQITFDLYYWPKQWRYHGADYNVDGFCNGTDMDDFIKAFTYGRKWADFDANGFVNGDDFDLFMQEFINGC